MSEEQNKAPNEGEARVLSDDELKGIVGGGFQRGDNVDTLNRPPTPPSPVASSVKSAVNAALQTW